MVAVLRTGFARTEDGQHLYWRACGEGPTLACCNGVGVSTFFWKYVVEHFRDRYTVLLWDYRGHGRSSTPDDVEAADLSMERNADDMRAVLEHAGVETPAVLLGHSMGCQVIIEFALRHPELARGLVPMFGTYARPLDTFLDSPASRPVFDVVRKITGWTGHTGSRLLRPLYASAVAVPIGRRSGLVDRVHIPSEDLERYLEHLNHMDQRVFLRMVELMADHDPSDRMPKLDVPTLVIAGERDLFTPLHRSRQMAELLPDAELSVLPEGSHAAIVEHPETLNDWIETFLDERVFGREVAESCDG